MEERNNQPPTDPGTGEEQASSSGSGRVWRWLRRLFFGVLGLFLLANIIFQIPGFQNWLARQVTRTLSETLDSRVELDYIRFAFFDKLRLEGIFIEDIYGDTLLYGRQIRADFNLNPVVLLTRGLEIEALDIQNARFNIRRPVGAAESNLEYVLKRLFPPREQAGKPFRLNLREIFLTDVEFVQNDSVRGQQLFVHLDRGTAYLRELDVPERVIDVASLQLTGPRISLSSIASHPLDSLASPVLPADLKTVDSLARALDDTISIRVLVDRFALSDGTFSLHNYRTAPERMTPANQLDWKHLDVRDINIAIKDFSFYRDTFQGSVDRIALRELSGFVLDRLAVQKATVSPTEVALNGLAIETPYSNIGDTLHFRYNGWADWAAFNDEVRLDARLHGADVALRDIVGFVPALANNAFVRTNRDAVLRLNGRISGQINNLRARDLSIAMGEGLLLEGDFSSRNLAVRNEEFINLGLDRLLTDMGTLRQLIPRFDPPDAFNRLGRLDFSGRFDGFFEDFVAYGDLRTSIGRARLDMRMNLKPGPRRATYSGDLSLQDFDLGRFSGNEAFGQVDFTSTVRNGVGLVAETASAELQGNIQALTFRNYTYRNATVNGQLNRNFFNGEFAIREENIDFSFRGELDFRDSIPEFDFAAQVEKLDLRALNLSPQDLVLAGQVDLNLRNTRLTDMEGDLRVRNFQLVKDDTDRYTVDSIVAYSTFDAEGRKVFNLRSDVANGSITGSFDLDELPASFQQFLVRNYPEFAQRLNIRPPRRELAGNRFSYELHIIDSKGLNWLLSPQLRGLRNVDLSGVYDGVSDSLVVNLDMPRFAYGNLELVDVALNLNALRSEGNLDVVIDSTLINAKPWFSTVIFQSLLEGDTINFGLTYAPGQSGVVDKLNLNGEFYPVDTSHYQVRFEQSDLVLLEDMWDIRANNAITFGKDYIETEDFYLSNGTRSIRLSDIDRRGLALDLAGFEFGLIDSVWTYRSLDFAGRFDAHFSVDDVFRMEGLRAVIQGDTLLVNGDDYGELRFDAEASSLKSRALTYMTITRDTSQLQAEASFNLANLSEGDENRRVPTAERRNYLDLNIRVAGYPMDFAGYWIGGSVSDIKGTFGANMRVRGLPEQLDVSGFITAENGALTVDYLQTRYRFTRSLISISNTLFDASGTILYDRYGNRATVYGGISHNRLKNLGLNARMRTNNFLALDLQKGDNPQFYGRAVGSGEVSFTGNFVRPDIYVNASVGDSTHIIIPASGQSAAGPLDDIRFVNKHQYTQQNADVDRQATSTGVSLDMELRVTEGAVLELVFDEQAGDIIRGSGRGNIRVLVPRNEEFQMFGDFVIEQGNYLFTLYNVVNKDFRVKPGGTISWSGDPFGAEIRLEAEYQNLKAPVGNFIQEYLNTDPSLSQLANQATNIDLTLRLQGQLLRPNISFDINFPALPPELVTYVDNKRRLLQQDQNELNRQVFGLIVVGQFLPSDLSFRGSEVVFNTLSEFASNQLSMLLTGLFSEVFGDNNVLSGVNFDIAYNQYRTLDYSEAGDVRGNELEVTIRQNFLNDRLSLTIGGNVYNNNAIQNAGTGATFVGNDLVIEYILNPNRTLKLRLYQRLEPDIGGGRRLQVGTGVSWRREFNNFGEFWRNLRGETTRMVRN